MLLLNCSLALAALWDLLLTCMSFFSFFHSLVHIVGCYLSFHLTLRTHNWPRRYLPPPMAAWLLFSCVFDLQSFNLCACVTFSSAYIYCWNHASFQMAFILRHYSLAIYISYWIIPHLALCVFLPPYLISSTCNVICVLFNIHLTYSSLYYCFIILCWVLWYPTLSSIFLFARFSCFPYCFFTHSQ